MKKALQSVLFLKVCVELLNAWFDHEKTLATLGSRERFESLKAAN